MSWFGDVGNSVKGFFDNVFSGNKDDEEKKRRAQQAKETQVKKPQFTLGSSDTNKPFTVNNMQDTLLQPPKPLPFQANKLDPSVDAAAKKITETGNGFPYAPKVIKQAEVKNKQTADMKAKADVRKKNIENTNATVMGVINSAGKAVQEAPKGLANLPGLFTQAFDWVGDTSSRAGQSFSQSMRGADEETKKRERAALDEKLNNDTLSNLARGWYGMIDDASKKTGLQELIDNSDKAIQSNVDTLVKNQGDMTTAQKLLFTAGEVGGNVVDPLTFLPAAKAITLTSKIGKGAKALEAVDDIAKVTKGADEATDVLQLARQKHVDLQKSGADESVLQDSLKKLQEIENDSKLVSAPKESKKVTWVNNKTGEKVYYTPKSDEEYLNLVKMIDSNGTKSRAGTIDANGNVFHVTAGELDNTYKELKNTEDFAKKFEQEPAVTKSTEESIPQVKEQAAQQAQGSNGNITREEMMNTLRQRQQNYNQADESTRAAMNERKAEANPNSREAIAANMQKAGLTQEDVMGLTDQYGMTISEWNTVLNRVGDLSKAKSKPAVIVSELRKMRNEGVHGQTKAAMNNNVTAQRLADEAEKVTPTVDTPGGKVTNPFDDPRFGVDKDFTEKVRQAQLGNKVEEPVAPTAEPNIIDTPQGKVNTDTGEIITDAPTEAPATNPFKDNLEEVANEFRTKYAGLDKELEQSGTSTENIIKKVMNNSYAQAGVDGVQPVQLTELETKIYNEVLRPDLDETARIYGQKTGKEVNDLGENYVPGRVKGKSDVPTTAVDNYNTGGFGYGKNSRTFETDLGDFDYTPETLVDYHVRGRADETRVKSEIYDRQLRDNPEATPEGLVKSTEEEFARVQNINKVTEDPKADVKKIDTIGSFDKQAEATGKVRAVNDKAPTNIGLNAEDRLKSVGVYDEGFGQYRFAGGLSQDIKSTEELPGLFKELGLTRLNDADAAAIVQRAERQVERAQVQAAKSGSNISEKQLADRITDIHTNAVRTAARANIDGMMRDVKFTDKKTRELLNSEYNRIAIGFNKAQSTMSKFGVIVRRVMNSSMRNLNVNSFLNEMSDLQNVISRFGFKSIPKMSPLDMHEVVQRYGLSHRTGRFDASDAQTLSAFQDGNANAVFKAANTIDEKTAIYHYAEDYKASVYLKAAEDYYGNIKGLQGTELRQAVLDSFNRDMLPLDHFSRVFETDSQGVKLLTQYLDWNVLNTRQQARNLVGSAKSTGGLYDDAGRSTKVIRNLGMNLAPRVAQGMIRGTPIVTTLGVLDPFGFGSQDYSGIQDKNPLDDLMSHVGVTPLLSLASNFYFNYRQDEQTKENYDGAPPEDKRGDWLTRSLRDTEKMFTPLGGQLGSFDQLGRNLGFDVGGEANGRGSQMVDTLQKGYSENKNGRVQYLAPDTSTAGGVLDSIRGWLMGKGQTNAGREYSGTPDIFSVLSGKSTPLQTLTSNPTFETLFNQPGDYMRPASDSDFVTGKDAQGNALTGNFNDNIKGATDRAGREAALGQARDYNAVLDNFRKTNPKGSEAYDQIMNNNDLVQPEYWRSIVGDNSDGSVNLDIFHMIADRKKEVAKSFGAPYDPMYDLPDDRARAVLQLKGTATGDDLALRNVLYKEDWYQQYNNDRTAYYDKLPESTDPNQRAQTERVKQWDGYNKQLTSLTMMDDPAVAERFPYTSAYKKAQNAFEAQTGQDWFNSQASKDWFSQYGQGYMAEKEALDSTKLQVINEMRAIEGFPPMSADAYTQATNIADTSGKKSGGGGGGKGQYDFIPEFFNQFKAASPTALATKEKAPTFKPNTSVGRRTNQKIKLK